MKNTIEYDEMSCHSCTLNIHPQIVSFLACSKTCGLGMLVDKLLASDCNHSSTNQLIRTLINRIHHNTIAVTPSSEDDVEQFILNMIETAMQLSQVKEQPRTAIGSAARLLMHSIQEFEKEGIDLLTLEHNWKEFMYQSFRSRLDNLDTKQFE